MHVWMKRGLQAAVVTGGLLFLGTGIASAEEDVNPDRPANPIDAGITVPIDIGDNVVGTPLGEVKLPGYHGTVSTKSLTDPVSKATPKATAPRHASGAPAPKSTPRHAKPAHAKAAPASDPARGNRARADLVVPVQVTGNALAAGGPATVTGSNHKQTYDDSHDITTSGSGEPLAGNVVDGSWAVPVQFANNALSLAGAAKTSHGRASQDVKTGGADSTDGTGGTGSGNVLAGQWATPVQVTGNAASWGGSAEVEDSKADNTTHVGGPLATQGQDGTGSGNVGALPLALPTELNGNAPTWGGVSDVKSSNTTDTVTAGGTRPGLRGIPTYAQTSGGGDALASGNIVQPQGAGIANVASVAPAWVGKSSTGGATGGPLADPLPLPGYPLPTGNPLAGGVDPSAPAPVPGSTPGQPQGRTPLWPVPIPSPAPVEPAHPGKAGSSSTSTVTSGGNSSSSGGGGTASSNIVDAPLAAPAEVFGVAGNWGFESYAAHDNKSRVNAGGGTFANGNRGTGSGNTASVPVAASPDLFGVGGAWLGNSYAGASNDKKVNAGGYNGTLGNDSTGSGNLVTAPAALPAEVFGVGGAWGGQGIGVAEEQKTVTAGSSASTDDDNGTGSANLVAAPVSAPTQLFGVGGAWVGRGIGEATNDTHSRAGGNYHANGKKGVLAGNLGQVPVSQVTQGHGTGASWIGYGQGVSDNTTGSRAGGTNTATGEGGTLAGNVVNGPAAGTGGVFALAPTWIGRSTGDSTNDVTSNAGGDTTTNGDLGQGSGNVLSAQAVPVAQVFGDAASWLGGSDASAVNDTSDTAGGDITTSGTGGTLSGGIGDVPASAVAQVFGNSAVWGGESHAWADNTLRGQSGGTDTTDGINQQVPLGAVSQVTGFHPGLLGVATSVVHNDTSVVDGNDPARFTLPVDGSMFG